MKAATHSRKGAVITNIATGEKTAHKSINAAKRESRKIQMSQDGALGRGSMVSLG